MAKIINFQEYVEMRNEEGEHKRRKAGLPDQSKKIEETEEEEGKRPYMIVILFEDFYEKNI